MDVILQTIFSFQFSPTLYFFFKEATGHYLYHEWPKSVTHIRVN